MNKILILLIIILIFETKFIESIYSSPSLYSFDQGQVNYFASFGFLKGGTFKLNAIKKPEQYKRVLNDTSLFGLCTFDQLYDMGSINPCKPQSQINSRGNARNIVGDNNSSLINIVYNGCSFIDLTTNNETQWSGEILETNYYSFVYFSCFKGTRSISIEISYENLNPNGDHLSMEYLQYPQTFLSFTIVWSVISILWFINWFINRDKSSRLFFVITLIPLTMLIYFVYSTVYYYRINKVGDFGMGVIVVNSLIYSLQLVTLLMVLMVISIGYGIVPKNFKKVRLLLIIIGIILFVGTFIGSFYSGHFLYVILITYLPVALFIIFVAQQNIKRISIIMKIKEDASSNEMNLGGADKSSNQAEHQQNEKESEIEFKRIRSIYYLFVSFKWIMVPYVFLTIIISLVSIYIYQPWVFLFIQSLLNLLLFILIAITFRLKKSKKNMFYEFFDENTFNDQKSKELE